MPHSIPPTPQKKSEIAAAAVAYCRRGWSPIPIPFRKKGPVVKAWQTLRIVEKDVPKYWNGRPSNIGVLLGEPSGWLVDIDLDHPRAVALADEYLPTTPARFGRSGKPLSHWEYLVSAPIATKKHESATAGMIVEIRSTGAQTVFPPSTHPSGELIEWETPDAVPASVAPDILLGAVAALADAVRAEIGESPTPTPRSPAPPKRSDAYGQAALSAIARELSAATKGTRNEALNRAGFRAGQLIGGGEIIEAEAVDALFSVASNWIGDSFTEAEARKTIASGIDAGKREPRTRKKRPAPNNGRPKPAPKMPTGEISAAKPEVLTPGAHVDKDDRYFEVGADTFTQAVVNAIPAGTLYRRAEVPGEIVGDPGQRFFSIATNERMRIMADGNVRLCKWIAPKEEEKRLAYVPTTRDHAALILAAASVDTAIPEVKVITSHPLYVPGFSLARAGYHEGVFYDRSPSLSDLTPADDAEEIRKTLDDLIIDFPFKDEPSRQNYIGLMLTPLIRMALEGANVPLHLGLASKERTGKTKLVEEGIGGIYLGRKVPAMQASSDDIEMDKRIVATLMRGTSILHLDNIRDHIDSASLASLMTASIYSGRLLGASKIVELPNNVTLIGTGNNVTATGEIVKRTVPIELQPRTDAPELRRDFVHFDFFSYVLERRRAVLECLIGAVELWKTAGQPAGDVAFGGFNRWADVIGGILSVIGYREWMANAATWRRDSDPRGNDLLALVTAWWEEHQSSLATGNELLEIAKRLDVFPDILAGRNDRAIITSFSMRVLSKHVDTPIGRWTIRRCNLSRPTTYRLEERAGSQ